MNSTSAMKLSPSSPRHHAQQDHPKQRHFPIFAFLPSYNPFVGTFHHAPSAGNRGAVYFTAHIVGLEEVEERKRLRHHPLTGTFHALPGFYDPFHGLEQFRMEEDPAQEEPDEDHLMIVDRHEKPKPRLKPLGLGQDQDSEEENPSFFILTRSQSFTQCYTATPNGQPRGSLFINNSSSLASPIQIDNNHPLYIVNEQQPLSSTSTVSTDSTNSSSLDEEEPDGVGTTTISRTRCNSEPIKKNNDDDFMMKSSSRDRQIPHSHNSYFQSEENNELHSQHHGYISLEKGVFKETSSSSLTTMSKNGLNKKRKAKIRDEAPAAAMATATTTPSSSSPPSVHELYFNQQQQNHHEGSSGKHEYNQCAPTVPANPFIARRLQSSNDQLQLRVCGIDRLAGRTSLVVDNNNNGNYDAQPSLFSEEEEGHGHSVSSSSSSSSSSSRIERGGTSSSSSLPKPYFIHEDAVTLHYDLVGQDQLGDGSYAVVKPAIHRVNLNEVAIKQVHKRYLRTENAQKAVEREVEIHLRLRHQNIVRLHEVYETPDFLYLVMSKANFGTLADLLLRKRRLSEVLSGQLAQQIVRGVLYLHDHGVLHGDLKPANVLLSHDDVPHVLSHMNHHPNDVTIDGGHFRVEICDFGLAMKVPDVRYYKSTGDVHKVPFQGMIGTSGYIAPELIRGQAYGKAVDMWALGVMVYELLTGYQPFYPPAACVTDKADFTDRLWTDISPEASDFVQHLLEPDPLKRWTAQRALSHPWFEKSVFISSL